MEAGTYTAKYRDGSGIVRKVATGCRDESAARSVLADLERRAEKVKGEDSDRRRRPARSTTRKRRLPSTFDAYLMKLEAEGTSPVHRANVRRALDRLAADCQFNRLPDLPANPWKGGLCRKRRPAWGRGPGTPTGPPPWPSATGAWKRAG